MILRSINSTTLKCYAIFLLLLEKREHQNKFSISFLAIWKWRVAHRTSYISTTTYWSRFFKGSQLEKEKYRNGKANCTRIVHFHRNKFQTQKERKKKRKMASMRIIPKRKRKNVLLQIHVCDNNIKLYNHISITIWIVNTHFIFHSI